MACGDDVPMDMRVAVFGANGWIGGQFLRLLDDKNVEHVIAESRPGQQPDCLIEQELIQLAPSHVISLIGPCFPLFCFINFVCSFFVLEATKTFDDMKALISGRTNGPGVNSIEYLEGGPDKLKENLEANLYAPCALAHLCQKLGIHYTYIGTGCIFQVTAF